MKKGLFKKGWLPNKKPVEAGGLEIDWSHPAASKLRMAHVLNAKGELIDLAHKTPIATTTGTVDFAADAKGRFAKFTGAGGINLNASGSAWNFNSICGSNEKLSALVVCSSSAPTSRQTVVSDWGSTGNNNTCVIEYTGWQQASGSLGILFGNANGADYYAYAVLNAVADQVYTIGATSDGITTNTFVDGVTGYENQTQHTPTWWTPTGTQYGAIGQGGAYTPLQGTANVYLFYLFDDTLPDAVMRELTADPYQLLKPAANKPLYLKTYDSATTYVDPASVYDPTASVAVTVTGTLETVSLDEYSATVTEGSEETVTGTLETLTLTEYAATVTAETEVRATGTLEAIALTEYPATVTAEIETRVTGTLDTIALTEYAATITAEIETRVTGTLDSIALTEYAATVTAPTNVTGSLDTITLTEYPATITYVLPVTDTVTGGWYESWQPTKEQIRKQRIELGIIKPEIDQITRVIKKISKGQLPVEKAQEEAKEYFDKQDLRYTAKHAEVISYLTDYLDKNKLYNPVEYIAQKAHIAAREAQEQAEYNELVQALKEQQRVIEEQDIIFVITCLAA